VSSSATLIRRALWVSGLSRTIIVRADSESRASSGIDISFDNGKAANPQPATYTTDCKVSVIVLILQAVSMPSFTESFPLSDKRLDHLA
jgi:hypothetical protein